jgi:PII-like signaling protein
VLAPGPAKKVTIHLNEDTSSRSDFLSNEILSLLYDHGVAGATVMRPEAGFGAHHHWHTRHGGIDSDRHQPLRIEFIESAVTVDALLPQLEGLLSDGLIEAQDTIVLKSVMSAQPGDSVGPPTR